VILLVLSNDSIYCANLHSPESAIGAVQWYKERVVSDITLGSLCVLVLVRVIQGNMRQQDAYIGKTCLAVLCNMAPHAANLHPYAAQRMVFLFEVLSKRSLALRRRFASHAQGGGGSGSGLQGRAGREEGAGEVAVEGGEVPSHSQKEGEEMLSVCMELRRTSLELLRLTLSHGLARNPHLIYALIHKRQIFDKYALDLMYEEGAESAAGGGEGAAGRGREERQAEEQAFALLYRVSNVFSTHVEAALNASAPAPPLHAAAVSAAGTHASDRQSLHTASKGGAMGAGVQQHGVERGTQASTAQLEGAATPSPCRAGGAGDGAGSASNVFCSVDKVVELIKDASQSASVTSAVNGTGLAVGELVKYKYHEDDKPEHFFTPYLWSLVIVHTQVPIPSTLNPQPQPLTPQGNLWAGTWCTHTQATSNLRWNAQRLRLFDISTD
jgi:hypothetical protein